jgi:hypothetical protein
VAPIGGRIEVSTVSAGALVTANQTQALTTIQQLDPMHVDIVQSSAELLALRRQLDGQTTSRQVELVLEDGSVHPQTGVLQFSGVTVDRGTGTVTLRAVVPNPQGTLLPGMVVQARLARRRRPRRAAGAAAGRDPLSHRRGHGAGGGRGQQGRAPPAAAGARRGQPVAGHQRAAAGDRLIVEGLQRVRADQTVTPVAAGRDGGKRAASAPRPQHLLGRHRPALSANAMASFFIDRPIFAWVLAIVIMLAGAGRDADPAAGALPRHRADAHLHQHQLPRRFGQDHRGLGDADHRAEPEGHRRPAVDRVEQQRLGQRLASSSASSPAPTPTPRRCRCRTRCSRPCRACRRRCRRRACA